MPARVEQGERRRVPPGSIVRSSSSACSCIPASMSRRSRLIASSCCAISSARPSSVDQAFDAERHVGQPARALRRGPSAKPRSKPDAARARGRRWGTTRRSPAAAAGAHPLQSLPTRSGCCIEPHDVGDGAERDQIEQAVDAARARVSIRAAPAQLGAQRQQDIEHDPDARDALLGNSQPGWFGLTMHARRAVRRRAGGDR